MVAATLRQRALVVALMASGVALSWVVAKDAAVANGLPLVGAVAAGLFLIALTRPRATAIGVLALGATVLPDRWGQASLAGHTDFMELTAFLSIAVWLVLVSLRRLPPPRFGAAVAIVLVAVVQGVLIGGHAGASRHDLQGEVKAYALYLLPLVFTSLFASTSQQDLLERWLLVLSDAGTAVTILVAAELVGWGSWLRTNGVDTLGGEATAQRLRAPVLALLTVSVLVLLGRAMDGRASRADACRIVAYLIAIALSFNRSTWVPLVLAVLVLSVLRRGRRTPGRGLATVLAVSTVGVLVFGTASAGVLGPTAAAAAQRAASTFNPAVRHEQSYADRQAENRVALRTIERSPVVGVGLARPYGARRALYFDNPPRLVFYDRLFIHDTYLGVWLHLGVLGLLGLLTLAVAIVREAGRAARNLPALRSTRHLAAAAALFVFAVSATFQTSLTDRPTILAFSCALALLQVPRDHQPPARSIA